MKTRKLFAVMAMIIAVCVVNVSNANAQSSFYNRDSGLFDDGVSFYAGFGGGALLVDDMSSPAFSVRLGADAGLFIGELEVNYLSINSVYNDFDMVETNRLSTATAGVNLGVKFLRGSYGHLALMVQAGYALQEDWRRGGHHGCFNEYYCYECDDYYNSHSFHGKHYLGVGVNGSVNLSQRVALFGEARYQSIPIGGRGDTKWGGAFFGGIKFYFY